MRFANLPPAFKTETFRFRRFINVSPIAETAPTRGDVRHRWVVRSRRSKRLISHSTDRSRELEKKTLSRENSGEQLSRARVSLAKILRNLLHMILTFENRSNQYYE